MYYALGTLRNRSLRIFHTKAALHKALKSCLRWWIVGLFNDDEYYFAVGEESLSNTKCELMNTFFARTTDYLANERSTTRKIKDKEQTSIPQGTLSASKDSALLPKLTRSAHCTTYESQLTSGSYTSLDIIAQSFKTSRLHVSTATEVTTRKSPEKKDVAEKYTVDAIRSTKAPKSPEGIIPKSARNDHNRIYSSL